MSAKGNMGVLWALTLTALALILGSGKTDRASALCEPTSFQWQLQHANLIFVGTVSRAEPVGTAGSIFTKYQFSEIRYLKGRGPADSLVLTEDGGTIGNQMISMSESVFLGQGVRYVVLADSGYWGRPYNYGPMMCAVNPFSIRMDSTNAHTRVNADWEGSNAPVAMFDDRHLVVVSDRPWTTAMGVWRIDADGTQHAPEPPPRMSLNSLLKSADDEVEARAQNLSVDEAAAARNALRLFVLYPHQDPGTRVTEKEFIATLERVIERVHAAR